MALRCILRHRHGRREALPPDQGLPGDSYPSARLASQRGQHLGLVPTFQAASENALAALFYISTGCRGAPTKISLEH